MIALIISIYVLVGFIFVGLNSKLNAIEKI